MRYNKNRENGKETLDEHDLLIETRLCGNYSLIGKFKRVDQD